MQIQVPFFTTFRHYNQRAKLLFFTNLQKTELPHFLLETLNRNNVEIITLPYSCRPPKGWFKAWMNQFYLYDILKEMEKRMKGDDVLLVCDADCLCRKSLDGLFEKVRVCGSAFYKIGYDRSHVLNGTSIEQMETVYEGFYGEKRLLEYFGGEFIALRGDAVALVNKEFSLLSEYNFSLPESGARLHEEAHTMSVLAARLDLNNDIANGYVKRLWTARTCNNVESGDEELAVWHMPAEKKTGLYRLYRYLERGYKNSRSNTEGFDEEKFWRKAGAWCGIPRVGFWKKLADTCLKVRAIVRLKLGF